jgi:hypothetical protein
MITRFKWAIISLIDQLFWRFMPISWHRGLAETEMMLCEELGYDFIVPHNQATLWNRIAFVLCAYFGKGYYFTNKQYPFMPDDSITYYGKDPIPELVDRDTLVLIRSRKEYMQWMENISKNESGLVTDDVEGWDHPGMADYWID